MALDSGIAYYGLISFIFLIVFGGLVSIIPVEFVYAGRQYTNQAEQIPSTWNGIDLTNYNFTGGWNTTLTTTVAEVTFDIGGRNLKLYIRYYGYDNYLILTHRYGLNLWFEEDLDWYNEGGIKRSYEYFTRAKIDAQNTINEDYETYGLPLVYDDVCLGLGAGSSYFKIGVLFDFNITLYDNPNDAWINSDLDIFIGITAENANYTMDIWFLITSLLMFNTLEVFGTTELWAIVLNGIIVSPFWAGIVIFVTAIALEVLPEWL